MGPRWTIYCHTHIESGRKYVGLTKKTMLQRWNQHVYMSERLVKGWSHFANAIRKYGRDAFGHEVLGTYDTLEDANMTEQEWIEKLGTRDPGKGFNFKRGGDHVPHPVKNPWDRPEFREKMVGVSKRTLSDPVVRKKISDSVKETWKDPVFRAIISERSKRQWSDPETRPRQLEATRKKSSTPEFRFASRSRWDDPFYRAQCSVQLRERDSREAAKTHCKHGHEYTPENTRINRKRGGRSCRACKNAQKNSRKISCPNGHPLIPGNFYLTSTGRRLCSMCGSRPKETRPLV